jgi:acyl carrier protein
MSRDAPGAVARDSTADVLATVAAMVSEVIGEDFLVDAKITMDTSFADDLEMESIEFVALAEQLEEHYGDRVDFVSWIAGMEMEEIIALSVGELVDHIVSCLT